MRSCRKNSCSSELLQTIPSNWDNRTVCEPFVFTGNGLINAYAQMHFRYEESIERNIELESKGDESQRKIADLEAELRRVKEKFNDATNALRKMHEISQDSDKLTDGSVKRTRSLSPGKRRRCHRL